MSSLRPGVGSSSANNTPSGSRGAHRAGDGLLESDLGDISSGFVHSELMSDESHARQ